MSFLGQLCQGNCLHQNLRQQKHISYTGTCILLLTNLNHYPILLQCTVKLLEDHLMLNVEHMFFLPFVTSTIPVNKCIVLFVAH